MAQTYTIWFNTSFLKITSPHFVDDEQEFVFDKTITTEQELLDFLKPDSILFKADNSHQILVSVKEPEEVLEIFKQNLKLIYAAGGVVINELNQILLIKRNGFWDLPKGKREPEEQLRFTAIREVEEETGVKVETASEQSITTYHCYCLRGEYCIKETHWFEMNVTIGEQMLTPQTDEGIETVIWIETADLPLYKEEMYPMIWSILESYHF